MSKVGSSKRVIGLFVCAAVTMLVFGIAGVRLWEVPVEAQARLSFMEIN